MARANANGWRPWLTSEIRTARRLRRDGHSLRAIADLLGRSWRGVQERLKTSRRGRPPSDLGQWVALFTLGLSDREIADRMGCSVRNVRYYRARVTKERRGNANVRGL